MTPKPAQKITEDVPVQDEDADIKKKRKFKRKTLFDRNYKKLNKVCVVSFAAFCPNRPSDPSIPAQNKTQRVAVTSSRM